MTCEHEWGSEETLREKTFGIAFGVFKRCKKCQAYLFADYTEGRVGGPWRIVYPEVDVTKSKEQNKKLPPKEL